MLFCVIAYIFHSYNVRSLLSVITSRQDGHQPGKHGKVGEFDADWKVATLILAFECQVSAIINHVFQWLAMLLIPPFIIIAQQHSRVLTFLAA